MRLALVGYGKMGRLIEKLAQEQGHEITVRLDDSNNSNAKGITAESFREVDVAIDFSTPDSVVENAHQVAGLGVDLVIGTTGWTNDLRQVTALAEAHDIGIIWSPNFSIGVNVFFKLVAEAATLLRDRSEYGAWAYEIHHSAKKDAPSGTLLKLLEEMKDMGYYRGVDVSSNRAGSHPGTHEIGFDSLSDTICLKHIARNRDGFALGALLAAKWIHGKKGFHEFGEALFPET